MRRRPIVRRLALGGAVLAIAMAGPLVAAAAVPAPVVIGRVVAEKDVCALAHHTSGEPAIAVNPRNRNNVIVLCFSNAEWGALVDPDPAGTATDPFGVFQITEAYTFDGGRTWRSQKLPVTDPTYSYTSDPDVQFGPDGTAFAAANLQSQSFQFGGTPVLASRDGGRTWGPRIFAMHTSDFLKQVGAGQVQELPLMSGPIERPWISVDQSRDLLYASAVTFVQPRVSSGTATPGAANFQRYVNVSRDHGKTWSLPVAVDSAVYPTGDSGVMAAAQGLVAVAYAASGGDSAHPCPCSVFSLSADQGKTWRQTRVPGMTPGGLQAPWIAADQHHKGRFTIMNVGTTNTIMTAVTDDSGRTWKVNKLTVPITGETETTTDKGRLEYAPNGTLGVIWRTYFASNSTYQLWGAISRDGGFTFARPFRISSAPSTEDADNGLLHDDGSDIWMSNDTLYTSWGDQRSGIIDSWFAAYRYTAGRGHVKVPAGGH